MECFCSLQNDNRLLQGTQRVRPVVPRFVHRDAAKGTGRTQKAFVDLAFAPHFKGESSPATVACPSCPHAAPRHKCVSNYSEPIQAISCILFRPGLPQATLVTFTAASQQFNCSPQGQTCMSRRHPSRLPWLER